jgi:predicted nucleic acid-binding Zn ribbon protein
VCIHRDEFACAVSVSDVLGNSQKKQKPKAEVIFYFVLCIFILYYFFLSHSSLMFLVVDIFFQLGSFF